MPSGPCNKLIIHVDNWGVSFHTSLHVQTLMDMEEGGFDVNRYRILTRFAVNFCLVIEHCGFPRISGCVEPMNFQINHLF